jgi:predicted RNA-binding Zn ribbon-like protein
MHVRGDSLEQEVRVTVDAAIELANVTAGEGLEEALEPREQLRAVLVAHDFLRAQSASAAELDALADRLTSIGRLVRALPASPLTDAVAAVNRQLEVCAIAPSLRAHDGFPLHIHWTGPSTSFAHQVAVDLLMAVAQTLCDHGTERFGRCAAHDCDRVFFDATKNRSRRFCTDPRCASRTHTAAHRARLAADATPDAADATAADTAKSAR